MKLTAVVPIYGPTYTERMNQLEVILTGSRNVKLLIVADTFNVTDRDLLKDLIKDNTSGEIELIEGNFGNPGSARNAALDKIETNWFCFWDSDDRPDTPMYLEMIEMAEAACLPIAKGGYKILPQSGKQLERIVIPKLDFEHRGQHLSDPGLWRYVFQKDIYGELRFPAVKMGEDQDYLVQALLATKSVHIFPDVVYSYYVGGSDQLTRTAINSEEVLKSLVYLARLRNKETKDKENNEIIVTSFLKQFTSLLIRGGYRITGENSRFIIHFLFESMIRREITRPVKNLLGGRLK